MEEASSRLLLAIIFLIPPICVLIYTRLRDKGGLPASKETPDTFFDQYRVSPEETFRVSQAVKRNSEDAQKMREKIINDIGIEPMPVMIEYGLLAQIGKISHNADCVFNVGSNLLFPFSDACWRDAGICPAGWEGLTAAQVKHKFMIWYDEQLRSHGMPYQLRYVPPSTTINHTLCYFESNSTYVSERDVTMGGGRYYWEPIKTEMLRRRC